MVFSGQKGPWEITIRQNLTITVCKLLYILDLDHNYPAWQKLLAYLTKHEGHGSRFRLQFAGQRTTRWV